MITSRVQHKAVRLSQELAISSEPGEASSTAKGFLSWYLSCELRILGRSLRRCLRERLIDGGSGACFIGAEAVQLFGPTGGFSK